MIDKEIRELIIQIDPGVGETIRLEHQFTHDGEKCSVGKDPCLNITRVPNGFKYFCHRCHESGYFPKQSLTPERTAEIIKHLKDYTKVESGDASGVFNLPADCIPLVVEVKGKVTWNVDVPFDAQNWLWKYWLIEPENVEGFNLQWSPSKRRLLFPIYKPESVELIGWVGRNVDPHSDFDDYPKWITNKADSDERLLYILPGTKNLVVYTEDVVSALRVHQALGCTTVALLTTTITFEICSKFKEHTNQLLWLDGDMKSKMLKYVMKMRAFGIPLRMRHTELDPKDYSNTDIHYLIMEDMEWPED